MSPADDDVEQARQYKFRRATDDTQKVIAAAVESWLDKKWATFGKWSATGIILFIFSALAHAWLSLHAAEMQKLVGAAVTQQ